MSPAPLTQSQRNALVDTSLALLVQEQPEAQRLVDAVSAGSPNRGRLALRALLAIRPAIPLPSELSCSLERLLSAEAAERDTVDALSLPGTEVDPRLSLWRGDITTIRADAIVNAANSAMLGCFQPLHTCIDNAIHSTAGPGLRQECADIMAARRRPEPTGTATVTGGYHLPAAHVIHTVGPIVQGEPTSEHEALLASSYQSCLLRARGTPSLLLPILPARCRGPAGHQHRAVLHLHRRLRLSQGRGRHHRGPHRPRTPPPLPVTHEGGLQCLRPNRRIDLPRSPRP